MIPRRFKALKPTCASVSQWKDTGPEEGLLGNSHKPEMISATDTKGPLTALLFTTFMKASVCYLGEEKLFPLNGYYIKHEEEVEKVVGNESSAVV